MTLHPVLVSVPQDEAARTPEQVRRQRESARLALRICAKPTGAPETGWQKDTNEVPLPQAGYHWSVAHKRLWAAAVIAPRPVGIDIEEMTPRRDRLHDALAAHDEWTIIGDRSWQSFFRLWTAKEATLKATGTGIAKLLACRLVEIPDERHMTLEYEGRLWRIEHYYHANHVAAVTCDAAQVDWHVIDNPLVEGIDVEATRHQSAQD